MSVNDRIITLSVRLRSNVDAVIKVRISKQLHNANLTTQSVSNPIDLNVKEQTIFDEKNAILVKKQTSIDNRQIVSAAYSQNTIADMMSGGDGLKSIAAQMINVIGDSMRDVASVAGLADTCTHEAILNIDESAIENNISVTAIALVNDALIGSVTTQISLLKQYLLVSSKISNPVCEFRTSKDLPILSIKASNNLSFIYKREIGRTALQNFELIAKNYHDAEINFDKSLTNICEIVAVSSDLAESGFSSGTRLIIKPQNKTLQADAKFIVLRSSDGFDLCVKDLFNVDFVTFTRRINNVKTIIAISKIEAGQRSLTISDNVQAIGAYEYEAELQSGSNTIKLPRQIAVISSQTSDFAKPTLANVVTSVTLDGLRTAFDIQPSAPAGDASLARAIIKSDASSDLFASELATQRSQYDHVTSFNVLRIDRDTGDEVDLGAVSSSSFVDVIPSSTTSRNFRYAVFASKRDPESLLQFVKFVSGSQPYSYYPSVYKHPYALYDGVLVKQDSRQLRHPFVDAVTSVSSKPSIVDVTFQPSDGGDISISVERIAINTVLVTITDQLHQTRAGYVVLALGSDGQFELVGYVNSFSSRIVAYHNVSIVPDTLTYALAALAPDMSVSAFIVGPSIVLS